MTKISPPKKKKKKKNPTVWHPRGINTAEPMGVYGFSCPTQQQRREASQSSMYVQTQVCAALWWAQVLLWAVRWRCCPLQFLPQTYQGSGSPHWVSLLLPSRIQLSLVHHRAACTVQCTHRRGQWCGGLRFCLHASSWSPCLNAIFQKEMKQRVI